MTSVTNNVFDLLSMRMDYLKQRQSVVAQNVANADTPGYGAHDLVKFTDALKGTSVSRAEMAVTNASHLTPTGRKMGSFGDDARTTSYETLPTGNNVVLEEQMMKVSEINADYQLASNLYKRSMGMMKIALGRGNA